MKSKLTIKNTFYYFQGNIRYKLYYSSYRKLIRKHIIEQIEYRINSMNKECYHRGSCSICGCMTTQLQMCNKQCNHGLYPRMLSKKEWMEINKCYPIIVDEKKWMINTNTKKFIHVK